MKRKNSKKRSGVLIMLRLMRHCECNALSNGIRGSLVHLDNDLNHRLASFTGSLLVSSGRTREAYRNT